MWLRREWLVEHTGRCSQKGTEGSSVISKVETVEAIEQTEPIASFEENRLPGRIHLLRRTGSRGLHHDDPRSPLPEIDSPEHRLLEALDVDLQEVRRL